MLVGLLLSTAAVIAAVGVIPFALWGLATVLDANSMYILPSTTVTWESCTPLLFWGNNTLNWMRSSHFEIFFSTTETVQHHEYPHVTTDHWTKKCQASWVSDSTRWSLIRSFLRITNSNWGMTNTNGINGDELWLIKGGDGHRYSRVTDTGCMDFVGRWWTLSSLVHIWLILVDFCWYCLSSFSILTIFWQFL